MLYIHLLWACLLGSTSDRNSCSHWTEQKLKKRIRMSPGITAQAVISNLSLLLNLLVRRVAMLHPSSAQILHRCLHPSDHIVVPQSSLSSVPPATWGLSSPRCPSGTAQPDVEGPAAAQQMCAVSWRLMGSITLWVSHYGLLRKSPRE